MSNISDAYEFWDVESFNADKVSKENPTEEELKWDRKMMKARRIHSKSREGSSMKKLIRQYKQRQSSESFSAAGVCVCSESCNCNCGCEEFGVCLCNDSCPCDCGCGVSKERPTKEEIGWEREMMKAKRIHSKAKQGSSMRRLLRQYKQIKSAESFEAEVCPCGCAIKGCVCSSSCKGECLGAEEFGAEYELIGRRQPRKSTFKVSDLKKALKNANDDAEIFVGDIAPVDEDMLGEPIVSAPRGVWTDGKEVYILGAMDWIHTDQIDELTWNRVNTAKKAESFEADVDWEGKSYTGQINPDDPDLDPVKADRNKDGKLSSWERALGNQVAKGMREGGYSGESFEADCYVCEAEGFEACEYHSEEFELHDWYDDMSDYGEMITHPVIQEQKEEYLEGLEEQREDFENQKRTADINRRVEIIDAAVNKQKRITNIHYRPPPSLISLEAKPLFGIFHIPKVVKWGVLGLIAVGVGYKVTSN